MDNIDLVSYAVGRSMGIKDVRRENVLNSAIFKQEREKVGNIANAQGITTGMEEGRRRTLKAVGLFANIKLANILKDDVNTTAKIVGFAHGVSHGQAADREKRIRNALATLPLSSPDLYAVTRPDQDELYASSMRQVANIVNDQRSMGGGYVVDSYADVKAHFGLYGTFRQATISKVKIEKITRQ